ncbi:MurR/RpiR family transcriptional regulator [Exilibacterium tricleocarpae]|uniref:MurR/RpiR family transcriptional regulator n=1 Tax=Exilibacterium tricleocarpae TaxID=2591008 RepID=A0A545SQI0_9GAMM|nr:MurR/RpiR family transcriptional regulator [Exilibacterium tricleocarpae]TQV67231.1 MurR/RpiR family transcriptional regulator [Exilibacterium tricleocarpae]
MVVTGKVFASLKKSYEKLTATDKRIAAILSETPEFVAFGTVADVAAKAETSGPSVVRLAEKLGYSGFSGIQSAVRDDLSQYLSSSLNRIEQNKSNSVIEHTKAVELHNVEATLAKLSEANLRSVITLLSDLSRSVFILASDQCLGAAQTFRDLLHIARSGTYLLQGSEHRISSYFVEAKPNDILLCMDFERHENWVMRIHEKAVSRGLYTVAITNNPLSSLSIQSQLHFFASATAPGPFNSNTGLNALLNVLITEFAKQSKDTVSKRIVNVHKQWKEDTALEANK